MLLLSVNNDVQHGCDASTPVFAQVPDSFFPIVKTLPSTRLGNPTPPVGLETDPIYR